MAWLVSGPVARWITLLIVAGITIPLFIVFLNITPSSDDYLIYLQGSSSLNALSVMQRDFPLGSLDPYTVVISTGQTGMVPSAAYFSAESAVRDAILNAEVPQGLISTSGVSGLSYFRSTPITLSQSLSLLNVSNVSPLATAYRAFVGGRINSAASSSLLNMETLVNPNSNAVVPFVKDVRRILSEVERAYALGAPPGGGPPLPSLKLYLIGGYCTSMDIQDALYTLVPQQIALVVTLVLIIIGVSFGSVILALRLLVTLFVSLSWTYGVMVLVYQPGPAQDAFSKLTPSILASTGVYWIIPIMSFSILVGLALDYDVFLMARVVEFRRQGWSDRASVSLAVEKTAGVISVAGFIMAVSFVGLLM